MGLGEQIDRDFAALLHEYGTVAVCDGRAFPVMAGQVRTEQELELGGMAQSPELRVRFQRSAVDPIPAFGALIEVKGASYRVSRVVSHPNSPLVTLELVSPDE
jgi:hypothetical protein